jgi:hypothetical protein
LLNDRRSKLVGVDDGNVATLLRYCEGHFGIRVPIFLMPWG